MAKRSGGGASRAQRKEARARKRQANVRGLASPSASAEAPAATPAGVDERAPARTRSRLPLLGKVGLFLLVLFVGIWVAAQFRQGPPG